MSDLISRKQTLEYAKAKMDVLEHAYAGDITIEAAKLLVKRIIQNAPDAQEQPSVERVGHWIYKDLDDFLKYEVECSKCGTKYIGNYDAYDEPGDFNYCPNCGSRNKPKDKQRWLQLLQPYYDRENGLSYKTIDLQCPVCKEWLGSAEQVEECPNCGAKMETEEKNDNRRLRGNGNMEPFEEKEKEEEKGEGGKT